MGGDFSDVFVVDDNHVVALIGDVSGKGVKAAGHTETVRAKMRAFATIDPSPAFILGKTNELLLRFDPNDSHVTVFLVVLDPHTGRLSYASAGHPAPVHLAHRSVGHSRSLSVRHLARLIVPTRPPTPRSPRRITRALHRRRHRGPSRRWALRRTTLLDAVCALGGGSAQEVAEGVADAALAYGGRLRDDLQVLVLRRA